MPWPWMLSSMPPLQSLSFPSQISAVGPVPPTQIGLPTWHWTVPGVHSPVFLPQEPPTSIGLSSIEIVAIVVYSIADLGRLCQTRSAGRVRLADRVVHARVGHTLVDIPVAVIIHAVADFFRRSLVPQAVAPLIVRAKPGAYCAHAQAGPQAKRPAARIRSVWIASLGEIIDDRVAVIVQTIADLCSRGVWPRYRPPGHSSQAVAPFLQVPMSEPQGLDTKSSSMDLSQSLSFPSQISGEGMHGVHPSSTSPSQSSSSPLLQNLASQGWPGRGTASQYGARSVGRIADVYSQYSGRSPPQRCKAWAACLLVQVTPVTATSGQSSSQRPLQLSSRPLHFSHITDLETMEARAMESCGLIGGEVGAQVVPPAAAIWLSEVCLRCSTENPTT